MNGFHTGSEAVSAAARHSELSSSLQTTASSEQISEMCCGLWFHCEGLHSTRMYLKPQLLTHFRIIERDRSPKNHNSGIIYSLSCHSKPGRYFKRYFENYLVLFEAQNNTGLWKWKNIMLQATKVFLILKSSFSYSFPPDRKSTNTSFCKVCF